MNVGLLDWKANLWLPDVSVWSVLKVLVRGAPPTTVGSHESEARVWRRNATLFHLNEMFFQAAIIIYFAA